MILDKFKGHPLAWGFVVAIAGLVYFAFGQKWEGFTLTLDPSQLVAKMSPLILTAAFVERAVEILISPWRDAGAAKLHRVIDAINARPANPTNAVQTAVNAANLQTATTALEDYRSDTQKYAFAIGLVLSLCAAVSGLRALWPFVADSTAFAALDWHQKSFFRNFDVAITAALLAGGADGIHGLITTLSDNFSSLSKSTKATM